jgi:hypothetical protein
MDITGFFTRQPIANNTKLPEFHTIFGFNTYSKIAAIAIDIIYWFIIFVAYCFAFHALNNILITWNWFLVGLACFAVVGLPYCVKIILFGRKEYPLKAAVLCLFLSLLPTIFDFTGLYSETGVQDSLKTSKIQITDTLSYFEAESKKSVQNQELQIKQETLNKKNEIENNLGKKVGDIKKQIEDANQEVINERQGVRGKAGDGPRAKELQAEMRKLQAQSDIEVQQSKAEIKRQTDALDQEEMDKLQALNQSTKLLNEKLTNCKKAINNTSSFRELETSTIDANSLISSIASTLDMKFVPAKIQGSDNIIKVSFGSLVGLDITALVCFLLAFLMEIGDIIITFVMRYEKKVPNPIVKQEEELRNIRYSKTYTGY